MVGLRGRSIRSGAPRRASTTFGTKSFSAKLYSEGASGCHIGKTPTIILLLFRRNYTSMSRLNVSHVVKLNDPTTQCDIQPARTDGKLDDVGVFSFVRQRPTAADWLRPVERAAKLEVRSFQRRSRSQVCPTDWTKQAAPVRPLATAPLAPWSCSVRLRWQTGYFFVICLLFVCWFIVTT
jgi:hypothetical protein